LELGLIVTTQVTIEATEAETSVHDARRADVEKSREVAEAPLEVGQEAAQPESQPAREEPQQDRPTKQAVKVKQGVVMPPSIVQAVVPTVETPAPPQGSTSAVIDLTVDDPSSDKGKQKADVETIDAPVLLRHWGMTWPRHRPGGMTTQGWRLYGWRRSFRARVGRPWSLGTRLTPALSPSSPSMTRTRCIIGSSSRDSVSTPCNPYTWSWIP
jgi:hypothetical protein